MYFHQNTLSIEQTYKTHTIDTKAITNILNITHNSTIDVTQTDESQNLIVYGTAFFSEKRGYALISIGNIIVKPFGTNSLVTENLILKSVSFDGVTLVDRRNLNATTKINIADEEKIEKLKNNFSGIHYPDITYQKQSAIFKISDDIYKPSLFITSPTQPIFREIPDGNASNNSIDY